MKKYIFLVSFVLLLALALSSCSAPMCATLLTGGEGGTYYSLGNALSELLESDEDEDGEKVEGKFTGSFDVVSTSGYRENIDKLASGEATLAILRNDIANYALTASGVYAKDRKQGFSLVAELYSEAVHVIAQIGTGEVSALSGKKVCVGSKGSADEIVARAVLDASGVKSYVAVNLSIDAAIEAFKKREIDAYVFVSGIKSRTVTTLSSEYTFEMLGLTDDAVSALTAKYKFLKPFSISKKTYSVMKGSINTVTLRACLMASDKADEKLIYNIAKRFAEDASLLNHKKSDEMSPKEMWAGTCLPIHDGADKYRKEFEKKLREEEAEKKPVTDAVTDAVTDEVTGDAPDET